MLLHSVAPWRTSAGPAFCSCLGVPACTQLLPDLQRVSEKLPFESSGLRVTKIQSSKFEDALHCAKQEAESFSGSDNDDHVSCVLGFRELDACIEPHEQAAAVLNTPGLLPKLVSLLRDGTEVCCVAVPCTCSTWAG